jgi:hypothetical protein
MKDFSVQATHRPGEIARIANALSKRSVNIKSIAAAQVANQGVIHFVPDDVEAARASLQEANIRFDEHEIVTVLLENQAGELAGTVGKLADQGVNLLALYVTGLEGDLVELAFVADDPKKAKKVLE